MTASMSGGCHQNPFTANEVSDVIGKSWDIDAAVATGPFAPQKRLTNDSCADTLNLGAKPRAQA
ncbi:hypothetical protein BH18VER1_BH18VER1_06760 [soil metagenome]